MGIMTDELSWVAHFVGDSDNLSIKLLLIRTSQNISTDFGSTWMVSRYIPTQSIAPLLYLGLLCVYFSETFPFKPDRIQCKAFVHVIAERTKFVFVSLSQ